MHYPTRTSHQISIGGIILLLLLALSACKNHLTPNTHNQVDLEEPIVSPDEQIQNPMDKMIWRWEYNEAYQRTEAIQNFEIDPDTLTVEKIVSMANTAFPKVGVEYVSSGGDTLYMRIIHSDQLTQRMGTTGAQEYMVSLTFSLTELANVRYVNYDMEEGDHMGPGTYSRQSVLK